ncbi:hypothetical protein [Campylobacter corcagiensis]|uniref:SPOR domain-containing protein n=1 Tax=Campylobacter corcagiensis TaxID=1448857 RepID=A0A7M1LJF7_9BACT|nr:hypothetical protein [Campylobacter corcagiensis]QKF64150.1 hypothetical protein CCORG_0263 [Campylobacter corcagiensis]QOQ87655.1 SPOR domain-containing protein [Campylobacter corcagiensis]
MSDKFNIDDSILLDPDTARSNNIKKILTGIAILVVLFLIILLTMKFINSGDTATNEPLVMPSEDAIFTPEKSTDQTKTTEEKTVVEIKSTPTKVEPKVVEIKVAQEPKKEDVKPVVVETKQEAVENTQVKQLEPKKEVVVVTADKTKAQPAKKVETPKQEPAKAKEVTKTDTKKQEVSQTEIKKTTKEQPAKKETPKQESSKPIKKGTHISGNVPNGSYIQVIATTEFKNDDPALLKLINAGYSYRLYKETVNGREFTKVLVGPYKGSELQNEMSNIRATVNKDAFLYRVK